MSKGFFPPRPDSRPTIYAAVAPPPKANVNYLDHWLNTVQCIDCVQGLRQLPENSIDLVVTSPPYDEIRKYKGFELDLHATGKEVFRVLLDFPLDIEIIFV